MTKLSCIMPVFKPNGNHLKQAIESVLNNSFKDLELLILNDSPDYIFDFDQFLKQFKDNRIKYFENSKNLGAGLSYTKLINKAESEYIAICDHDDISVADRFITQINYLDKHKDIDCVSGLAQVFEKANFVLGNKLNNNQIQKCLLNFMAVVMPTCMFRKTSLMRDEMFNSDYFKCCDYEFFSRRKDLKNHILDKILIQYRLHDNNTTGFNNKDCISQTKQIQQRNLQLSSDIKIKSALVCIAKDEDNYINEWLDYHLKLGFDRIFVYCNDWNWFIPTKYKISNKVVKINFNGQKQQVPSYDDFIQKYYQDFDFACFTDIDEFIVLHKWDNINDCLKHYTDVKALRLPIKTFGNNGLDSVCDNNYSVLNRFTKCRKVYEHIGKYIVNLMLCKNKFKFLDENWFGKMPCVNPDKKMVYNSYYCMFINDDDSQQPIELNHYITKTWEEYFIRKSNSDVKKGIVNYNKDQILRAYCLINRNDFANEIENTRALEFSKSEEK